MPIDPSRNPRTFKEHELAGWSAKAGTYGDYFGMVTARIAPVLLDAAKVAKGTRLLDVASGPGYVAGGGAERGAQVTGIDFAATMVEEARKRFPGVRFQQGDAEALAFHAAAFDAVTCGFGIGHFAEPDKAIAEAFRVLRAGGRYALSWWASNDKHEFFQLFHETVRTLGNMDVPLPPAPPFARFSDPAECVRSLSAAGFTDVHAREHDLVYEMPTPRHALDMIYRSAVRSALLLQLQTPEARERIEEALMAGAMKFKRGDVLRFAFPAVVAAGAKP
jgi:ubiquinone/menaquinone biosynthesis C-methylase UbiE